MQDKCGKFVRLYAEVARPVIRKRFSADSCIASTRITLDVAKAFGIKGDAVPCSCAVINHEAMELLAQGRSLLDLRAAQLKIGRDEPGGPWSLGVGMSENETLTAMFPDRWIGHLVAVLQHRWLVDASLDQANRPHKNIELPGVFVQILKRRVKKLRDGDHFRTSYGEPPKRLWIDYTFHSSNLSYQTSPDWLDEQRRVSIVGEIVRQVEGRLK